MNKAKKNSLRRYIRWTAMALVVALLAAMPLMAKRQQAADGPVSSILDARAAMGSIASEIRCGGTLEAGDPEDIELPKNVKITEFLVKNGDFVQEGDPLAAVDKVSVMTAITEIQSTLVTLRKQMENARNEKADTTISATAGGRVKEVYAHSGDRVESVMLAHGALAVLSLDSKMCVTLENVTALCTGDQIPITLSDGSVVTGRVDSVLDGTVVITVEDKGYAAGQSVTVGTLGMGILEIHSPWAAVAFTGTVSNVSVKPEQTVSSGATLFTLKETDFAAQREILASTHREYEELLQKLFVMHDTGVISAPCDGMVSGIDKKSAHLLAAEEDEEVFTIQLLAAREDDFRLVLLNTPVCTNDGNCTLPGNDENHQPDCPKKCTKSTACTASQHFLDCIKSCKHGDTLQQCPATGAHYNDCIRACTRSDTCPASKHRLDCIKSCDPEKGEKCPASVHYSDCIHSCKHGNTDAACPGTKYHYTDCIKSCKIAAEGEPCPATKHYDGCYFKGATYYAQVYLVDSVGNSELIVYTDGNTYEVINTGSGWVRADGGSFDTKLLIQKTILPGSGGYKKGDVILVLTAEKNGVSTPYGTQLYSRSTSGNTKMPSISGGMPSAGAAQQPQLFDKKGDVLMTVTPQEMMTVKVAVDERDVSSVKPGMIADITFNALPGEAFEGEVVRVAKSGTGNGGSSKFEVEITLPRQSQMLAGMSASAVISLYEKMDVLTLPARALEEIGGKTFVYTELDKKTGEPCTPVEVTVGLSDGETVEILSGLRSGDTVYYRYYDTPEESDEVEAASMKMY